MTLKKELYNFRPPTIDGNRKKELHLFEKNAGIRFRKQSFLNLAFSHRSFANESKQNFDNNEKLEFLGDSVLGMVVSEYLYRTLTDKHEGDLARIKSFVVSEDTLAGIALTLKIDNFILIGKGEEYSGGRKKKAILADCMEAVIGAYFIDSGFSNVKKFILKFIIPEINLVIENKHKKDYKTLIQEYSQKIFKLYPKYNLVKKSGPDHNRTFWVEVVVNVKSYGPGSGKNKKEAEQRAASVAYNDLIENNGK